MSTRTYLGGTHNWSDTLAWLEAAAPDATSNIIFTTFTTGALTVDGLTATPSLCRSSDFTTYTGTFTMGSTAVLNIGDGSGGSLTLVAGMTYAPSSSSIINFVSTTSGNSITSAGKTMGQLVFNGSGGVWTTVGALACRSVTLTAGTLTQGANITASTSSVLSGGTFNGASFTFSGTGLTVSGAAFTAGGTTTLTAGLNVSAGTLDATAKTITGGTSCTLSSTGILNVGTLVLSTTFSATGGTGTFGAGGITCGTTWANSGGALTFGAGGVSATTISISGAGARSLDMGSGTWTATSTGTAWNATTITNLTFTQNTATILLSNTTSTGKTFAGGGLTYSGTIRVNGAAGVGGVVSITGANIFNGTVTFDPDANIRFSIASTQTFSPTATLNWSGTSGHPVTIDSTSAGTPAVLSQTSGTRSFDWLVLKDSKVTGGSAWYAGANSVDNGGNSGWIFGVPPPSGQACITTGM